MNRAPNATCAYCNNEDDTAKHTIFDCAHWDEYRLPMSQFIGGRGPLQVTLRNFSLDLVICLDVKTIPIYMLAFWQHGEEGGRHS